MANLKKLRLFLTTVFLLCCWQVFAQNKLNDKRRKEGLWIEKSQYGTIEAYYSDGKLNGFYREYLKENNMMLSHLGQYKQGKMVGDWYFFDNKSVLFMICKNLIDNKITIQLGSKIVVPKSSGYISLFYDSGKLKEVGKAIFDDVEIDFYKIGLWKYYDRNGIMVKQEHYIKPRLAD